MTDNYIRCNDTWFRYTFAYVDINEYAADSIFKHRKIPVSFGKNELKHEDGKYRVIFVKVRKKYGKEFLKAMRDLRNVMKVLNYNDYEDVCKEVINICKKEDK